VSQNVPDDVGCSHLVAPGENSQLLCFVMMLVRQMAEWKMGYSAAHSSASFCCHWL